MLRTFLQSGREVVVRPITPADAPGLQMAFSQLSERSRYQRFLAPVHQLEPEQLRYLTDVDGVRHVALVATPPDALEEILAVGRWIRLEDDPETAELAITVGDPYQREGLGALITDQLAQIARAHGVRRFTATMLADNVAIHRLLGTVGGAQAATRHYGSVDELDLELAA